MDPLSTTASIIAVIQLSAKVVQYISTATGATKERRRLRAELKACDEILQQLKDEADESEEGKAWAETMKALEAPGAPLGRLLITLEIVHSKLVNKSGINKVVEVLKWPFEEKELEKIIDAIEREKSLLQLALANDSRKLIQHITKSSRENGKHLLDLIETVRQYSTDQLGHYKELKAGIDRLHVRQDDRENVEKRQAILDWLTPIDYTSQHNDFVRRRQAGTGQWLLDSAEYQTWITNDRQTLFCPGIPGAGKTILTSIVIQNLCSRFQNDPRISIAYVYCNFRRQEEQKIEGLLSSLLRQLAQTQLSFPESVQDLYDMHKTAHTRPLVEDISRAVQSILATCSKSFIVVDALDECQNSDGCRSRFISEILRLQTKTGANFLATSRFIPEINDKLRGSPSKEILASEDDIGKYLKGQMPRLSSFVNKKPELQNDIITSITNAVDGMFLLAQLHFDSLQGKDTPKAIRNMLKNLATGYGAYDSAYKDAMERIEGQVEGQRERAKQVLSWIALAQRPLTTIELQHALAVEVGEVGLDEENLPQIEDMVSVCAGLVTVDDESEIIRLVHYTTQEYLKRTQGQWFPHAQSEITKVCTAYLSFEVFTQGRVQSREGFKKRLELHPFYDYAAQKWAHHGRIASAYENILSFLQKQGQSEASSQALLASKPYGNSLEYMTGLHLAAYFGLGEAVQGLWNIYNVDAKDSYYQTPLSRAAGEGHEAVVQLLIAKGAAIDTQDRYGQTPLSWAARRGHEAVVQLLIAKGAAIDTQDRYGRTPLSWAVEEGHEAVVQLLIAKGAAVDTQDENGQTPLSWAAEEGHEAVVQLLIAKGAAVDTQDENGRTPLSWAAGRGHEAVVQLLIAKGATVDTQDKYDRTPLSWAAGRGHEAVVQLLIAKGAAIDNQHKYGRTPLSWAAGRGHEAVVQLLIAKGAAIDTQDRYGRTPLSWAAGRGHEAVVQLLIAKGAKFNT